MCHQITGRLIIAAWALAVLAPLPLAAQTKGKPQHYTAVAVDLDRGTTSRVEFTVNRWSTDAERQKLMSTMMTKGADALLEALQDQPRVGFIQVNQGLGWDLHFAWREPGEDGGQRVILATDRPMSFWETANRPRSVDYPFTVIELHLKDGKGEGTLSLATRVIPNESQNIVILENFDMQRIRLTEVIASQ
ncbi:MAG: hypothetical protein AB7N65_16375 [Vicinamibacterales bacterium]